MFVVFAAFVTLAAEKMACPVMVGKIDRNLYVDADGWRINVCCAGCIGKVEANPQTYIKKLEDQGVTRDKSGP